VQVDVYFGQLTGLGSSTWSFTCGMAGAAWPTPDRHGGVEGRASGQSATQPCATLQVGAAGGAVHVQRQQISPLIQGRPGGGSMVVHQLTKVMAPRGSVAQGVRCRPASPEFPHRPGGRRIHLTCRTPARHPQAQLAGYFAHELGNQGFHSGPRPGAGARKGNYRRLRPLVAAPVRAEPMQSVTATVRVLGQWLPAWWWLDGVVRNGWYGK
jgi:hypothetical protein